MNELTQSGRLGHVRATAYAKLTLSLSVLGRREDGYHDLEALAVSIIDPHDILEVEAVPHPGGVTFSVDGDAERVPEDATNLAVRAAEDLLIRAGRSGHGVRMWLRKGIPAGAGLGGGSADAAAAFAAVRRMLEIDIGDDELLELGANVGSDVPFCIQGGAAWMRGRGEQLEAVTLDGQLPLVVVLPRFRISTPDVYRAWDELGGPITQRRIAAPPAVAGIITGLANDLEAAAEHVEPRLPEFRQQLEEVAQAPVILAGSGSAYAVIPDVKTVADAGKLANRISSKLRVPASATSAAAHGVRLSA
ncbi:MAG TPA: 4-(cytidine 5'-diphospho)-2-C-methyl-D-erythritol kinase [Acidimicrobiia bacterium]|nr:4-(cytidine 5'-diphospho)-2-C-methyl-D-erythritol kinase [Acidimicrobiia bacterium]